MRNKVTAVSPEITLARMLAALERELVEATDAEIREAAQDLGMNLDMKGSAAFIGLTAPAKASLSDFFDTDDVRRLRETLNPNRQEHDDQ